MKGIGFIGFAFAFDTSVGCISRTHIRRSGITSGLLDFVPDSFLNSCERCFAAVRSLAVTNLVCIGVIGEALAGDGGEATAPSDSGETEEP